MIMKNVIDKSNTITSGAVLHNALVSMGLNTQVLENVAFNIFN